MKNEFTRFKARAICSVCIFITSLCSVLSLSACRDGSVDETCYWGPVPNEARLKVLKLRGIKTIVMARLNPMHKVEENARALGINYVHIPTGLFTSPRDEEIKKFIELASNPENQPLYICDQVARDRTQFYAGLYGMLDKGWSADRATWQMYRNGLRHWWPWFYKYREIARAHEDEIRRARAAASIKTSFHLAPESGSSPAEQQKSSSEKNE